MKTLILVLITNNLISQACFKLSGIIMSKKDSSRISFVSIKIKNSTIGTITNTDGFFELNSRDSSQKLEIQISHINYRDTSIFIEKNKINYVKLSEHSVNLDEVSVSAESPYEIIDLTTKKLSDNFSNKEFFLKTFYKEIITKDKKNARYSEAFFNIYLPSLYKLNQNSTVDSKRKIELIVNRTYFDYKDTLVNICQSPYKILNNVFVNITPVDSSFYNYKMIENSNNLYVIDVSPKSNSSGVYSYECTINKNNYSFIKIKNYVSDFTFEKYQKIFNVKNADNTISIYLKYITEINFIKSEHTMQIASIYNYVKEKFIDDKNNYTTDIERNSYLFITEVYKSKIKLKNTMKKTDYLHKVKSNNDSLYWDNQNKLVETMNDVILKKQLE